MKITLNGFKLLFLLAIAVIPFAGCSSMQTGLSRNMANLSNRSANIKCFSGGVVIYEGRSKGKVSSEADSDGYNFLDNDTGKLMELSGECIITYD